MSHGREEAVSNSPAHALANSQVFPHNKLEQTSTSAPVSAVQLATKTGSIARSDPFASVPSEFHVRQSLHMIVKTVPPGTAGP